MTRLPTSVFSAWSERILTSAAYQRQQNGEEECYWERHASDYAHNRTSGPHFRRVVEWLTRTIPHGASVLEIGPGPAVFTRPLAEHCRTITVVEPSSALARRIHHEIRGNYSLRIVNKRWEDVSLPLHDYVFSAGTLHLFVDIRETVGKMLAHARSKVLLVLIDDSRALQREVADACKLKERCIGKPLSSLFAEVLAVLGLASTWQSFTEEQTYRYPDMDVLIDLWREELEITEDSRQDLLEYFRDKGFCNIGSGQIIIPRRFTSHLVEIAV